VLKTKNLIPKDSGYKYTNEDGVNMVEYHVDCCHLFPDRMNKETRFGGRLLVFGHEKCIFKQYNMSTKSRIGPNGETVPVPKDDG
jgi:hypothetical protein